MVHRRRGGVPLLLLARQGEFPWFPLELFSVGCQGPEEAVVPAGGGECQCQSRGEGDVIVMGGEAMGQLCCKSLPAAGGGIQPLHGGGVQRGIPPDRAAPMAWLMEREGPRLEGEGLPRGGEGQDLFLEVLFPVGEEGVALQGAAEAMVGSYPADAQRHGGEAGGPMGQGKGSDKLPTPGKGGRGCPLRSPARPALPRGSS